MHCAHLLKRVHHLITKLVFLIIHSSILLLKCNIKDNYLAKINCICMFIEKVNIFLLYNMYIMHSFSLFLNIFFTSPSEERCIFTTFFFFLFRLNQELNPLRHWHRASLTAVCVICSVANDNGLLSGHVVFRAI